MLTTTGRAACIVIHWLCTLGYQHFICISMNEHAARRAAHLSARTAMQTMQTTGILQQYTDRGQAHYSDPSNSGTSTTQKNCSLSPIGGRKKDTNGRVEFPSPQYIYVYDDSWEGVEMAVTDSIYSSSIYAPPPPRLFHAHHSTEVN